MRFIKKSVRRNTGIKVMVVTVQPRKHNKSQKNLALIAYFLMRGEIVSVSTICILLYPINVSKMCLNHKNKIIFLNKP